MIKRAITTELKKLLHRNFSKALSASEKLPETAVQMDTFCIMAMSNIRSKEHESSILLCTKDWKHV
jgi:hypothetical protein